MTNPIELLEHKLAEIKQVEEMCKEANNESDLAEILRQKQMYIASINNLKNLFKQ